VPVQSRVAAPAKHAQAERIDADGLPHVGAVVWPKQSYYTSVDTLTGGCAAALGRPCTRTHPSAAHSDMLCNKVPGLMHAVGAPVLCIRHSLKGIIRRPQAAASSTS
jgi:hypothetical protein